MKFNVTVPGKRLKKETRSSLVKIGKEIASLSDTITAILSTTGFVFSDAEAGKAYEIKVQRSATTTKTQEGEEI